MKHMRKKNLSKTRSRDVEMTWNWRTGESPKTVTEQDKDKPWELERQGFMGKRKTTLHY